MLSIEVRQTGTCILRGTSSEGQLSCTQLVHGAPLTVRLHRTLDYGDVDMGKQHNRSLPPENTSRTLTSSDDIFDMPLKLLYALGTQRKGQDRLPRLP